MSHNTNAIMTVVQCWDDGVTADVRLTQILRRHGARATVNLNAGRYEKQRQPAFPGWTHKGTEVWRLGWDEVKDVYDGFTIGNHSHTHPPLLRIPIEAARRDIVDGRKRLQDFFGQPVLGFAYPCGNYNDAVEELIERISADPNARWGEVADLFDT